MTYDLTVGQKVVIYPLTLDPTGRYTEIVEIGKRAIKTSDGRKWVASSLDEWGKSDSGCWNHAPHIKPLTPSVERDVNHKLEFLELQKLSRDIDTIRTTMWPPDKVRAVHAAMKSAGAFKK